MCVIVFVVTHVNVCVLLCISHHWHMQQKCTHHRYFIMHVNECYFILFFTKTYLNHTNQTNNLLEFLKTNLNFSLCLYDLCIFLLFVFNSVQLTLKIQILEKLKFKLKKKTRKLITSKFYNKFNFVSRNNIH